jgi:hypothetical protein
VKYLIALSLSLVLASYVALICLNAYVSARVREHDVRASFEVLRGQHQALERTLGLGVDPAFVCRARGAR